MGYFMRFFVTSEKSISIDDIADALCTHDNAFTIENTYIPDFAEVYYDKDMLGELEISRPVEDIFAEEIDEYKDLLKYSNHPNKQRVMDTLNSTRAIVAIEAVWEGDDPESTLAHLDALWDWMFAEYEGLLLADGEGFYVADDLILEMNVTG